MSCSDESSGNKQPQEVAKRVLPPSTETAMVTIDHCQELKNGFRACSSCGHHIICGEKDGIHNLPGLPAGVKFDPSDQELLEHLEAKVRLDVKRIHPLIDDFIRTIEGDDGICYTHPEKLPDVNKDGSVRHFFHRPSKAYTTGTRKRRKVQSDLDGSETRWHKTGKTRPVLVKDKTIMIKGYKKILVLYINYGKQRKPEKTNWVMHQYHLGNNEDEKEGELVVSKIFYQTQPRQCGIANNITKDDSSSSLTRASNHKDSTFVEYYNATTLISFDQLEQNRSTSRLLSFNDGSFV